MIIIHTRALYRCVTEVIKIPGLYCSVERILIECSSVISLPSVIRFSRHVLRGNVLVFLKEKVNENTA